MHVFGGEKIFRAAQMKTSSPVISGISISALWMVQNLGEVFIRTNMYMTVLST